jgi:Tol biopolymer transport system component/tRNA A-37 threonylcarbamoyl transferase component Bud32
MTDVAARLESTLADRYRIERELGAGGMATVYLAEDVRHHRKVAIKVLHPELSAVLGPERFLKEIELTANLQHPHILPLFDSGNADGLLFYVMPYVEGETLRGRLEREQQLPVADALRIASEVADALEYAHKRGVVHRDVKPENILLHDGRPLVADFGIALAVQQAGGARMTQTGMSLGTPQYMAPEQAMGDKSVDHRADIYALGAITYEMLAGEPPFTGPNSQAIVAKVLTTDPTSLQVKRRSIPPHVEDAVLTALEKMPADRFGSAAEFSAALALPATGPRSAASARRGGSAAAMSSGATALARRPALLAGAALLLVAGAVTGWLAHSTAARAPGNEPVRFAFGLGVPGVDRPYVEISPDGKRILQVVEDSGGTDHIVMRELSSTTPVPIQGTQFAMDPAFSPDGAWISFTAEGKLRKVPAGGGPAVEVADSATNGGGSWTPGGDIVFTREGAGLWRVSNSGGAAVQLTQLDTARREFAHWSPQVLPGGDAVIYTSYATPISRSRVEVYEFASRRTKVLVEGAVFGRYSHSGHLLYMRDEAVFAIRFDHRKLETRGTAVPVQEDVAWNASDGLGAFAVSPNGTLVYLSAAAWNVPSRVVWTDRAGREEQAIPQANAFAEPRLSPDGRWIAVTISLPKRDIWLYEVGRRVLTRLTRAGASAFNPVWMPDSRSILHINEDPVYDIHRVPIDGSAASAPVVVTPWDKSPSAISSDGRFLAYSEYRNVDRIYIAPVDGSAEPRQIGAGTVTQFGPTFSPDGRWLAYVERVQSPANVYIAAADGSGGRRQVSVDGGAAPQWTKGGREIVYRRGDAMMAASVDPSTGEVGQPVELFRKALVGGLNGERTRPFDVSADGNQFLLATPIQRPGVQPTIVVLNWFEELKEKMGR